MNNKNKLMLLLNLYRATSYDIIFFYPIQIVFLYKCRGISLAQNVLLESCFWLFNFVMMTVATAIISKGLTAKRATIIGSTFWTLSILIYLCPMSKFYFSMLIIAEAIRALGLALKTVADFPLIREVLETNDLYTDKDQSNYVKVEGYAMAINCAGDALMAIVSVQLMKINKDLPMWVCLLSCIYGLVLSMMLPKTGKIISESKKETSYKSIVKNKIVFSLIMHATFLYGTLCFWEGLGKNLLQETSISDWGYGIVVALLYLANSVGAALSETILAKFKTRKSYIQFVTIANLLCFTILGFLGIVNTKVSIIVIAIILMLQAMTKTAYSIAVKTSLQKKNENGVKTVNLLFSGEHVGKAVILSFASGIVQSSSTALCYIILAVVLIGPCIVLNAKLQTGE